jgi:hypothetical protein
VNAKPTALATVVVVVVGVASGAAIGGKTRTQTRTVTVPAATTTSTDPGETTAAGETAAPSPPPGAEPEPSPDFSHVVLDEELVTIDDTTSSSQGAKDDAALTDVKYGVPAQLQQGPEKDDALTFDFESTFDEYAADYYQFEITVPEGATKLVAERASSRVRPRATASTSPSTRTTTPTQTG